MAATRPCRCRLRSALRAASTNYLSTSRQRRAGRWIRKIFEQSSRPRCCSEATRGPAVVQRIHTLLTRALPNCRVGSFDSGHMGPITHAHRVNPWIEAFLDTCADRDAAFAGTANAHVAGLAGMQNVPTTSHYTPLGHKGERHVSPEAAVQLQLDA